MKARPTERRTCVCAALFMACVFFFHTRDSASADEWFAYAADKAATRYSPLDQINPGNVNDLREAFRQGVLTWFGEVLADSGRCHKVESAESAWFADLTIKNVKDFLTRP